MGVVQLKGKRIEFIGPPYQVFDVDTLDSLSPPFETKETLSTWLKEESDLSNEEISEFILRGMCDYRLEENELEKPKPTIVDKLLGRKKHETSDSTKKTSKKR